jgi:hypothetical protein
MSVIIGGRRVELKRVGKFCYLGDMLNADGGVDSAVTAGVRCVWNKFKELRPFMTAKEICWQVKGETVKVYTCICTFITHGSEMWPLKVEHESELEIADMKNQVDMWHVMETRFPVKNLQLGLGWSQLGLRGNRRN